MPKSSRSTRTHGSSSSRSLTGLLLGTGALLLGAATGAVVVVAAPKAEAPAPGALRPNLILGGIPLDGKSFSEAEKLGGELRARLLAQPVVILSGSNREQSNPAQLGVTVDLDTALLEISKASAESPGLIDRVRDRVLGPAPREIPLNLYVEPEGVRKGLLKFAVRIGAEPRNARLTKVDGKFKTTPPKPGRELDVDDLAARVQEALNGAEYRRALANSVVEAPTRSRWLKTADPFELEAATRAASPRVTLEHLKSITGTLATFSTGMASSSRDRTHNVQLAAKAIDGSVLLPGDVFSYNEIVGPRVPAAGYRNAPVIVRGELQPGLGGGICQVSSTVYNAALLADLEVVRRRPHGMPVPYVPAGRDATVVDGAIDLRFKNRLEHPIAIDAKVVGGKMVAVIYGDPSDKREVEISTSGHARIPAGTKTISDPKLPEGKRVVAKAARAGQRVTVTRVVKQNGKVVRTEVVSRDHYPAFAGVVRVGTRPPAPAAPAPAASPTVTAAGTDAAPAEPVAAP
jgi:vancomycin resistance protein YoaR